MKQVLIKGRRFVAILIGIVFLGSGLLKIEDPVGTMLIVTEYLKLFHWNWLIPCAKGIGIVLGASEALIGVGLITGVFRKMFAWLTLAFLTFFTLVTLALWILNPAMDCGCFGQAIHLTHAQSFWKNVVMLVMAALAFIPVSQLGEYKARRIIAAGVGFFSVVFAVAYSQTHLPIADFTEFDLGAELFASLEDDIEADNHYVSGYVYEKDGQQGTFTLDRLPDSSWTFVRVDTLFHESVGMREKHPILSFRDAGGEYQDRLAAEGQAVVFSVYDAAKVDWTSLAEQYHSVEQAGGRPLLLVASTPEALAERGIPAGLEAYFADYKTLITLNRDNGGASYFDDGELVAKWTARAFPEDPSGALASDPVELSTHLILKRRIQAQGFCLYLAAALILL